MTPDPLPPDVIEKRIRFVEDRILQAIDSHAQLTWDSVWGIVINTAAVRFLAGNFMEMYLPTNTEGIFRRVAVTWSTSLDDFEGGHPAAEIRAYAITWPRITLIQPFELLPEARTAESS